MDIATVLTWILVILLIGSGIAGLILPALPGSLLVLGGLVLAAWADDFTRVGGFTIGLLVLFTALTYAVDFAASAMGAKKFGASKRAVIGAAIGTLAGLFFGLVGILIGPFVGAVIGEYTVQRDVQQAGRAGVGAWLGFAVGVAAKVALAFMMIGVFALAYWF